jgi:hypothetical protein
MSDRRYNASKSGDFQECRLVFLKPVSQDPTNNTLRRHGRFIWCRNLRYEGVNADTGLRQISFTVDRGQKRFLIGENNMVCLPSHLYVSNHKFFKQKDKTFGAFASVFSYPKALRLMAKTYPGTLEELKSEIQRDTPYKAGTLVAPRLGYFFPVGTPPPTPAGDKYNTTHPYGLILGPSLSNSAHGGREFYRVRFGGTTYEKVHPVEMEIINEV